MWWNANLDKFSIIIDGSNIALHKKTQNKKARYKNFTILIAFLKKLQKRFPIRWELVVDASLRHKIDNKDTLEHLINTGKIIQCPSKSEADNFILGFFRNHPENSIIISNDNFDDHEVSNLQVFKFAIIFEELVLYPNIEEFLESNINLSKEVKVND